MLLPAPSPGCPMLKSAPSCRPTICRSWHPDVRLSAFWNNLPESEKDEVTSSEFILPSARPMEYHSRSFVRRDFLACKCALTTAASTCCALQWTPKRRRTICSAGSRRTRGASASVLWTRCKPPRISDSSTCVRFSARRCFRLCRACPVCSAATVKSL